LHTYGDQWQVAGGRYFPLGGGFAFAPTGCDPLQRAGSAIYVTRTQ
jgi:hypothetical protein